MSAPASMRTSTPLPLARLATVLLLVLALGGCSSDGGSKGPPSGGQDSGSPAADSGPAVADVAAPGGDVADADGGPADLAQGAADATPAQDSGRPAADAGPPDAGPDPATCLGQADLTAITAGWPYGTVIKTAGKGFLASMPTADGDLYFPVLRGSHFQMGCQYAYLMGELLVPVWHDFLVKEVTQLVDPAQIGMTPEQVLGLIDGVLDSLWGFMEPYVAAEFKEELEGIVAGQQLAGIAPATIDLKHVVTAMAALANISDSGSVENMDELMQFLDSGHSSRFDEYFSHAKSLSFPRIWRALRQFALVARLPRDPASRAALRRIPIPRHSCSILGTWGEHTRDGHLIATRNLDWSSDTGISRIKALTFWVPDEGIAHVTVGYLGFFGALSGMSAQGLVTGEVGSTGVLERMQGTPWTIKHREVLMKAADLDEAVALVANTRDDGQQRPPTIGYNWLLAWGDPAHQGGDARAAITETNGIFMAVHRQAHDCTADATVYAYDEEGRVASTTTHLGDPLAANLESEAVEIDADGNPKHFQVDAQGAFVRDAAGKYVPDPAGQPLPVGKILPCALFRGDEAMGYAVRRWQSAANGPQDGPDGLMVDSGSYRNRYSRIHGMLSAYRSGGVYQEGDSVLVPDHGGVPVPVTVDEGVAVASAAAMSENVFSVAYDATALTLRVAFESGTGDTWKPASANEYHVIDAGAVFTLVR